MVLLMVAAATYAVLQLALVSVGTRTVRTSTLLLAMAAGGYGCGVLAIGGELAYTQVVSAVTERSLFLVVQAASYTASPLIEEVVKLAPVIIVLVASPRVRRQWSLIDYLVVGAATGTGFGLAEALLRTAGEAAKASPDHHGGFIVATSFDAPQIRGLVVLLTTWLPAPVDSWDLFGITGGGLNYHLVWSGLAGLGCGVLVRWVGRRRWLGLILIAYALADHLAMNYALRHLGVEDATGVLMDAANGLRRLLPALVLVAVVLAMVHDALRFTAVRSQHPELLLAPERESPFRVSGLLRMALVAVPWTPVVVLRFVLLRRAAWNELAMTPGRPSSELAPVVAHLARQLELARDRDRWRQAAARLSRSRRPVARMLRGWRVLVWLIVLLPAVAYLVVGATPATSGLQQAMASRPGLIIFRIASLVALAFLVGQLVGSVRRLRRGRLDPSTEPLVQNALRFGIGAGALAAGVVLVFRSVTTLRAGGELIGSFHILEALSDVALVAALALFLAALIYFPPLALVGLAEGGAILVVTQAAAASAGMIAGAAALGSLGVLLSEASDVPGPAPAPAPRGPGPKKGVRLDPATEAEVRAKLPDEWGEGAANKTAVGTRWFDPSAPKANIVRVDEGNPNATWPSQRVDHVVVHYGGKVIGPDGTPIVGSIRDNPAAHIPLSEWLRWTRWWRP